MNIKELEQSDKIILKSMAGSHLYGLNTPASDVDIRGIFMDDSDDVLDITGRKNQEISDEKQDVKYFGLGKFLGLAVNCNPNIIELLFLPPDAVLQKSPVYDLLVENRGLFISKRARHTFTGYAYSQIKKAQSENKIPNLEEKYFNEDGIKVARMCLSMGKELGQGLNVLSDSMIGTALHRRFGKYFMQFVMKESVPYDEGFVNEHTEDLESMRPPRLINFMQKLGKDGNGFPLRPVPFEVSESLVNVRSDKACYDVSRVEGFDNLYRVYANGTGFMDEEGNIVCHPITKERERTDFLWGLKIDEESYKKARAEYDRFWSWRATCNEARHTYDWDSKTLTDNKNLMHVMRLLICSKAIALTGIPKIRFEGEERQYLMDIRAGKYKYEQILETAEKMLKEVNVLFDKCDLPWSGNEKKVKELYCHIMKQKIHDEVEREKPGVFQCFRQKA